MLGHLHNPQLISTYLIGFNVLFSLVASFTYVTFHLAAPPFLLSTRSLSYLFVVYLVGLVATPAAGAVLHRVGLRYGLALTNLLSLLGILITLIPSVQIVGLELAMCCSGVFISQACATSYVREATPLGGRVSVVGLYIGFYYVGGTAGGVVPSYIWRLGGWTACAVFIAALDLLAICIAMIGWKGAGPKKATRETVLEAHAFSGVSNAPCLGKSSVKQSRFFGHLPLLGPGDQPGAVQGPPYLTRCWCQMWETTTAVSRSADPPHFVPHPVELHCQRAIGEFRTMPPIFHGGTFCTAYPQFRDCGPAPVWLR